MLLKILEMQALVLLKLIFWLHQGFDQKLINEDWEILGWLVIEVFF